MEEKFKNTTLFNIEEPQEGHEKRFLIKLQQQQKPQQKDKTFVLKTKKHRVLKIVSGIAAILLLGLFISNFNNQNSTNEAAYLTPEFKNTTTYFNAIITQELAKVESFKNSEHQKLINDALNSIKKLEEEYQLLLQDLDASGGNPKVIAAMIDNFQNRISLLQQALETLEKTKKIKDNPYENTF